MDWSESELWEALKRFLRELADAELLPLTLRSYEDYIGRFLRWREGDYRPRGAVGPGPKRRLGRATTESLRSDHGAYEDDLRRGGLQPAAIATYVGHPARFIAWLEGRFKTAGPHQRARASGLAPVLGDQPPRRTAVAISDLVWAWEGNVQAAVVAWLVADGWTVDRQADAKLGDHGVDIEARRGSERLAVEVKGFPQATYARGARAGEPKRWHPGAQARTYFGTGLHAALIQRDRSAETQVALAVPDVPTYRKLFDQVRSALRDLGIRGLLVKEDGSVSEVRR